MRYESLNIHTAIAPIKNGSTPMTPSNTNGNGLTRSAFSGGSMGTDGAGSAGGGTGWGATE